MLDLNDMSVWHQESIIAFSHCICRSSVCQTFATIRTEVFLSTYVYVHRHMYIGPKREKMDAGLTTHNAIMRTLGITNKNRRQLNSTLNPPVVAEEVSNEM